MKVKVSLLFLPWSLSSLYANKCTARGLNYIERAFLWNN